ncbi:hypothetical protein D9M68_843760 [compost metagenome]
MAGRDRIRSLLWVGRAGQEQEYFASESLAEGLRLAVGKHVTGVARHVIAHRLVITFAERDEIQARSGDVRGHFGEAFRALAAGHVVIDTHAHTDRVVWTDFGAHRGDQVAQDARAVLRGAAVFISALVRKR